MIGGRSYSYSDGAEVGTEVSSPGPDVGVNVTSPGPIASYSYSYSYSGFSYSYSDFSYSLLVGENVGPDDGCVDGLNVGIDVSGLLDQ